MSSKSIKTVAVIGAGLMGHGIALEFAAAGLDVRIHDRSPDLMRSALARTHTGADLLVSAGRIRQEDIDGVIARIRPCGSIAEAVRNADVIIEAIYEDLDAKRKVFAEADLAAPAHALLLTNSSSFMASQLASATRRPEKVAVAHYFNPPYLVPLVELVPGPQTAPETIEAMHALYLHMGKRPVVIRQELPGFVANRLQNALVREAQALVDDGVASPQAIDAVVKYGFGRRLALAGPFEIWEQIGWDLVSTIGGELWKDISRRTGPSRTYQEKLAAGHLGVKTGKGFYDWTPQTAEALRLRVGNALIELTRWEQVEGRGDRVANNQASPSPQPSPAGRGGPGIPSTSQGESSGEGRPPRHSERAAATRNLGRGAASTASKELASSAKHPGIDRVAVIGAGLMGHGIALEFAAAGYEVTITDRSKELLDAAMSRARKSIDLLAETGRISAGDIEGALLRISPKPTIAEAVKDATLVIEAVSENLELKQRIFAEIDATAPPRAILLSNTSTFLPSALAAATKRPDRVAVAHYFNPPHLLPVVEVVRGPQTSDATTETVRDVYARMGKRPALVQKEVLGFVGNRLQFAMFREALSLVQRGVVTAPELDEIVCSSFGRRLSVAGPFELRELIGLDLAAQIGAVITPTLDNFTEVPPILRDKVAKGELGTKTGRGFYDWTPESAEALRLRIGRGLVEMARWDAGMTGRSPLPAGEG